MEKGEIEFAIEKHLGVLSETKAGWKKEVNLVSWNKREAKVDIRDWSSDHLKMGKGITLTKEESALLVDHLKSFLGA